MKNKENKNKKFVKTTISKILKIKLNKINEKLKLGDVPEWDSLAHIQIFMKLKKKFKKINLESASRVKTINDWIKLAND
jgi:acyl carrier protein